ncbi:MAG: response regulator [Planctomycetales bacterium]|nr:MAG: response regulator [Planctomycetales bacterium]
MFKQAEQDGRFSEATKASPNVLPVDARMCPVPDSAELLSQTASSLDEGLCIIDSDGRLIFANESLRKMVHEQHSIEGRLLPDVIPHHERFKLQVHMKRICRGERQSLELTLSDISGQTRNVLVSTGPCQDAGSVYNFVMFTDITSIRRAEQEKLYLMEQVLGSRHMDRIGTLAGGLSHEMNNILQVIRANAEYCQLLASEPGMPREKLQDIIASTQRAERILKQLLSFSKDEQPDGSEFRMSELVRRVIGVAALRKSIPAGCSLELLTQNDLLKADEQQIEQVLVQLIRNAMQYLPEESGILRIRLADPTESMLDRLPVADCRLENYLLIEVQDNGAGIPGEYIDRIFDPFFTTRSVGQGFGLGLTMVMGIVSSLGGAIWASPVHGGGTCIRIMLRRVPAKSTVEPVAHALAPEFRVMLVDDEEMILRLGRRMLMKSGMDVFATTDPHEALHELQTNAGSYALLVTDQNMPEFNGMDLAEAARYANPEIKVVLCTGYTPDLDEERISELEIDAVLAKPFDIHELSRLAQKLLEAGAVNSGSCPDSVYRSA